MRPSARSATVGTDPVDLSPGPCGGIDLKVLLSQSRRPRVASVIALVLVVVVGSLAWSLHRVDKIRSAKEGIASNRSADRQRRLSGAYGLAVQAERYIPHDPALVELFPQTSWSTPVTSTPSGATVEVKDYGASRL